MQQEHYRNEKLHTKAGASYKSSTGTSRRFWGKSALALAGLGLIRREPSDANAEVVITTDAQGIAEVLVRRGDGAPGNSGPGHGQASCVDGLNNRLLIKIALDSDGEHRYELVPHDGVKVRKKFNTSIVMEVHPDSVWDVIHVQQASSLDLSQIFTNPPVDNKFEISKDTPQTFTLVPDIGLSDQAPGRPPFTLPHDNFGKTLDFEYRINEDDPFPLEPSEGETDHDDYHMES